MDEMRIGYEQTAVCSRPGRNIDVANDDDGWMGSSRYYDWASHSEKTENKMCKATRYDRSNRYRTRGQLCRLRLAIIWGLHIKQVDEVKGDARKNGRSLCLS